MSPSALSAVGAELESRYDPTWAESWDAVGLVCGDPDAVHRELISQAGRMLAEDAVPEEDWEDHLIFRAG